MKFSTTTTTHRPSILLILVLLSLLVQRGRRIQGFSADNHVTMTSSSPNSSSSRRSTTTTTNTFTSSLTEIPPPPPPSYNNDNEEEDKEQYNNLTDNNNDVIITNPTLDINQDCNTIANLAFNLKSSAAAPLSDTLLRNLVMGLAVAAASSSNSSSISQKKKKKSNNNNNEEDVVPITAFHQVLNAWSKSDLDDAADRAESLLQFLIVHTNLQPDIVCLTSVIQCWSKSLMWEDVDKAQRMLLKVNELCDDSNNNVNNSNNDSSSMKPDIVCHTVVMQGWSRIAKKKGNIRAAFRALDILNLVEDEIQTSFQTDSTMYWIVLNAFTSIACAGGTTVKFDTKQKAVEIAQELLDRMIEKSATDAEMIPSDKCYNLVLESWLRAYADNHHQHDLSIKNNVLQKAEKTMMDMKSQGMDISPEVLRAFIFSYSTNNSDDDVRAADKAYLLLMQMLSSYQSSNDRRMLPKTRVFNAVLKSIEKKTGSTDYKLKMSTEKGEEEANSTALLQKAYEILKIMEDLNERGIRDSSPDDRSYTQFIKILGNIPRIKGKSSKILSVLKRMEALGYHTVRPTIYTYNAAINAVSAINVDNNNDHDDDYSQQQEVITTKEEAFQTVIQLYNHLLNHVHLKPDNVTYTNMLRACILIGGDKCVPVAKALFAKCCKEGHVKPYTLNLLAEALDCDQDFEELVGFSGSEISVEKFPRSWGRKVRSSR